MKDENVLKLSRRFWDGYKLFLQEKLTRKELEKCFEEPGDLIFYRQNCNHRFNTQPLLEEMAVKSIIHTFRTLLSILDMFTPSTRKKILKKIVSLCFDATAVGK